MNRTQQFNEATFKGYRWRTTVLDTTPKIARERTKS